MASHTIPHAKRWARRRGRRLTLAVAVVVLALGGFATTAAGAEPRVTFEPPAGTPGTLVHGSGLAAACGEISEIGDYVRLFRSEGVYTPDELVFEPGAEVAHDLVPVVWMGADGEFRIPNAPPGSYVVYLQCYERDFLQFVNSERLTVLATGSPSTDAAPEAVGPTPATVNWSLALVAGVVTGVVVLARPRRRTG